MIGTSGANTAAVRCARVDPAARTFDLAGTWVPTSRLAQILAGLGLAAVPPQGLTLGVLVDEQGRPAAGYQIRTSPASAVSYLSETGQVVPGATATTPSGLFVTEDAPYGADVRAFAPNEVLQPRAQALGGRVNGKVTVVVLRLGVVAAG